MSIVIHLFQMVSVFLSFHVISLRFWKQLPRVLWFSLYVLFLRQFMRSSMLAMTDNLLKDKKDRPTIVCCLVSLNCLFLLLEDLRGYALCWCIGNVYPIFLWSLWFSFLLIQIDCLSFDLLQNTLKIRPNIFFYYWASI